MSIPSLARLFFFVGVVATFAGCFSSNSREQEEKKRQKLDDAPSYGGEKDKAKEKDGDKSSDAKAADNEAAIAANIDKLPEAEREAAKAQRVCPISGERLGVPSMGMPVSVVLEGKTVYLCCAGCKKDAEADPAKTLAAIKK